MSFNSSIRGPSDKPNPTVGKGDKTSFNKTGEIFNLYGRHDGKSNSASGNYSHAEGYSTQSVGNHSHAEGTETLAKGDNSHVEGSKNKAFGVSAHAEGGSTKAIGTSSHSEGWNTVAKGMSSHSEGWKTVANGIASHAEGINTIAEDTCQTVIGKFNKPIKRTTGDGSEKHTLLIIGNGNKDELSNIIEVSDKDVDVYGDVRIHVLNNNEECVISVSSLLDRIDSLNRKVNELISIIAELTSE